MSKSLIRKNQLHPDISDLIGDYGSNFFVTPSQLNSGVNSIQSVYITGFQNVSGVKNFNNRPTFSGIGLATTGDIISSSIQPLKNGQDVVTFLNATYFPSQYATIGLSIPSTLLELGTSYSNVPYVVTVQQNESTSISNLLLKSGNNTVRTITTPIVGTTTYTITPELLLKNTSTLTASLTVNNNGSISNPSSSVEVIFVAPSWKGQGANGLTNGVQTMTKYLNTKANRTFRFDTTNNHFYYAYPSGWGPLSSIIDPNNFPITTSFSSTTVNLILADSTPYPYRIYQSIIASTNPNFNITFNF